MGTDVDGKLQRGNAQLLFTERSGFCLVSQSLKSATTTHADRRLRRSLASLERKEALIVEERQTVVKTGGSNIGLIVLALAILVAAAVGFLFYQSQQSKNDAVTSAATAVGDAAKDVGDAVKPDAK